MAGSVRDWRVELINAYPDLFHPLPGDPPAAQGYPGVGDGWRDLLQRACARIRAAVQADGGSFKATQIKEKYGTLRFYWEGALSPKSDAKVEEIIDLAEARSASTCEVCGEMGQLYGPGWLTTRCAEHAEGRRPVEIRPGFENVHIEERFVGDRRVVRCRRYDRKTDSFIDVDPRSLGIEDKRHGQISLRRLRPGRRVRLRPATPRMPMLRIIGCGVALGMDELPDQFVEALLQAEPLDEEKNED
jgi:hypothetical protein